MGARARLFNVAWIFCDKVGLIGLSVISFWVVAQYLSANEIGTAVIILGGCDILALAVATTVSTPLLQIKSINDHQNGTFFWLNVILGGLLSFIISVGGIIWLDESELQQMLMLSSLTIPVMLAGRLYICHLQRNGEYKRLAIRNFVSKLFGLIIVIVLAMSDKGAWALIFQSLAMQLIGTLMMMRSLKLRIPFCFDITFYKKLIIDGWPVSLKALNWTAMNKGIEMILALVSGTTAVGYYNVAMRVVELPLTAFNNGLYSYAVPVMSRRQGDKNALTEFYMSATRFASMFTIPFFLGMAILAEPIVRVCLGEQWLSSVTALKVLAVSASISSCGIFVSSLLIAMRASHKTVTAIFLTSILVVSIVAFLGPIYGPLGAAIAVATRTIILFPYNMHVISQLLSISLKRLFGMFGQMTVASIAMGGIVIIVSDWFSFEHDSITHLMLLSALGVSVYSLLMLLISNDLVSDFLSFMRR